jgi:hypothetical protein
MGYETGWKNRIRNGEEIGHDVAVNFTLSTAEIVHTCCKSLVRLDVASSPYLRRRHWSGQSLLIRMLLGRKTVARALRRPETGFEVE